MIPKENTNLLHMRVFYNENTSLIPTTHHSYSAKKTCYIELRVHFKIISWREAHSSTGRLVTGGGGAGGGNTKLTITRSIFELEARNFACK